MGTHTISTVLKLEGEAEYRAALKNNAGELRVLKSELDLVSNEYRTSANSMEALTKRGEVLSKMYDVQGQRVDTLKNALTKSAATRDAEQKSVAEAREEYDRAKKALNAYGEEVDESDEGYQKARADIEKWRDEIIKHQAKLDSSTTAVNRYSAQLNRAEIELNNLKDCQGENNRLLDEARNSADKCATSMDRYGDSVVKAADGTEKSVSAVEALSSAMVASGVKQTVDDLAGGMMECSEAATTYELSLAKVGTLADPAALSQQDMRAGILKLSSDLGKGADEIADAAYQALSAGMDTANMLDFTRQATQLSVAGFTDAATSVDVLTTVLNAYKLSADQTEAVASKLVKTQDLGKITVDELGKVLGRVIPSAAAYGVNLDNVTAAYARMTASGINAENSTTYLSTMLDELADSGSAVAGVLQEKTGKSFAELMASGTSLGDIMEIIGRSVHNDSVQFSNLWSSSTAGKAALALFNSGAEAFNTTLAEMENSSGSVAANYAKMADTSDYASRRLSVANENLKIAVGDQLNPVLDNLRKSGAGILETASDFVVQNPLLISTITGVVTALGLLAAGLSGLMIVKSVTAAMTALNIAMSANPAVLIAVGIAGLTAAIATFVSQTEDANSQIEAMTEASRTLSETVKSSNQSYEDAVVSAEAATNTVDAYIDRLEELEEQGLNTDAQQMEYQMILDKINAVMPGINAELDEQTNLVKGGTAALRSQASAWKETAVQEAVYARYKDDIAAMSNAEYELAKNRARLNIAETDAKGIKASLKANTDALNDAQSRYDALLFASDRSTTQWCEAMEKVESEMAALNKENLNLNYALSDNETLQNDLREAIAENSETIEENRATVEAAEKAYASFNEQTVVGSGAASAAVAGATKSMQSDMRSTTDAYSDLLEEAKKSLGEQINLLDDMSGKCEASTEKMIANLSAQREAFENYATNIQTAMDRGINIGLVQQLSDGSTESMQILAELVTATDEQIAELNEAFSGVAESKETVAASMAEVEKIIKESLSGLPEDSYANGLAIGGSLVDGAIAGINAKKSSYVKTAVNLANSGAIGYKKANISNSPSKRWKRLAEYDVQGLTTQYQADTPKLQAAAAKMADAGYIAAIRARRSAIPSLTSAVAMPSAYSNDRTTQMLQKILSAIESGKTIVLDSNTLVGSTASQYDAAMGQRKILADRGAI